MDFVLCDVYAGAYLAHVYDDIYFAGTLNAPTDAGVACANDNSVLSSAVAESLGNIKGNGVFAEVFRRGAFFFDGSTYLCRKGNGVFPAHRGMHCLSFILQPEPKGGRSGI